MAPLLILPASATLLRPSLPPWAFMWTMAAALFLGFKWFTFVCAAAAPVASSSRGRPLAYFLAWPGMEASAFFGNANPPRPTAAEWLGAAARAIAGAGLIWLAVPLASLAHPLLAGWLGMFGIVLLLHFGLFHLLSIAWRHAGIDARPIMAAPLSSASLGEFWGRRWNTGFRDAVHALVFRPALRRGGPIAAMFAAFALSGLLHELVITLPARAGYGLPTAYFLTQALGVALQRSTFARRRALDRGPRGRLVTLAFLAVPLPLLFPPPFVRGVVLPLLRAVGVLAEGGSL